MVSGTTPFDGDPFLQRQNEPSLAVSTRNSRHLLAGANDYRTVDIPFIVGNADEKGDAWLGVYKSMDGGQSWASGLIPGYPQDITQNGLNSPLKGLSAASDPVVRAGTNGLFYYSGMAFNRGANKGQSDFEPGKIFVATFIDNNNQVSQDAIQYLHTTIVDQGDSQHFIDKAWLAVDIPRAGALNCVIGNQSFPGGNVYVAYSRFDSDLLHSQVMFSRSRDCGATWSLPAGVTAGGFADQGAVLATDPNTGTVYLAWRRINLVGLDSILITKSTDGGQTFSQPVQLSGIVPFDLKGSVISFRSRAYAAMTVDSAGRVYVAWSARGFGAVSANDARVVVTTSKDGVTWTAAQMVDTFAGRGHQFMPSLTYSAGKIMMVYYDSRNDHLIETKNGATDSLVDIGTVYPPFDLPANIFNESITDGPITGNMYRRHTIDVRATEAAQGDLPQFTPSVRVSEYLMGADSGAVANTPSGQVRQLRFNVPDLPLFALGNTAFMGDYIDVAAAPSMVPTTVGTRTVWRFNTTGSNSTAFHAAWTDNRDVIPPPDGDWTTYTAPGQPSCVPGREGMRNQNIYTSRIAHGLVVASPENSKPLTTPGGQPIQRTFVVLVQNTTDQPKQFQLAIPASSQPPGGRASFLQFSQLTQLLTTVPARSTAARTVFVSSSTAHAPVTVNVVETTAGVPGLQGNVVLNPDLTNPDPTNPDLTNSETVTPDLTNGTPRIVTPDLTNTTILTPDLTNEGTANFDPTNPDLTNLGIPTPDLTNSDRINPDLTNPDLTNQTIAAGKVTDATWTLRNTGDTTASYSIKFLIKEAIPPGFKFQLLVYKVYTTPAAKNCQVIENAHNILLTNIVEPELLGTHSNLGNPDLTNPDLTNATVAVSLSDQIQITLRTLNPDRTNPINNQFNPATALTLVATAHAANTGSVQPSAVASSLVIFTPGLPDGVQNAAYSAPLQAIGKNITGNVIWTASQPLPAGLLLNAATGQITGIPTVIGTFAFKVNAADQAVPPHADSQIVTIYIAPPLVLAAIVLPPPTVGTTYAVQLGASGGTPPFKWIVIAGALPTGMVLSTDGNITGTPMVPGHFSFTVQVTDSAHPAQALTQVISIDVATSAAFTGWTQLAPAGTPPDPRTDLPGVYDGKNNIMIVFGGTDVTGCPATGTLNDTWLLSNANGLGGTPQWSQLSPTGPLPPVRSVHTAVYNPSSNRMIIFGGGNGTCGTNDYNDVWVLTNANGLGGPAAWVNLAPLGGPPVPRTEHTAVYDLANNRMIISGGREGSLKLSDVWVLTHADGLGGTPQWIQLNPLGGPPTNTDMHSAVYDPESNRMTVFGGWNCCPVTLLSNELWILTNANGLGGTPQWIQRSPVGVSPTGRVGHRAVFDPVRKQMTVFGGITDAGEVNEVWTLSDPTAVFGTAQWTLLSPPGPAPQRRGRMATVYDPINKVLLNFGGSASNFQILFNDSWTIPIPPSPKRLPTTAGPVTAVAGSSTWIRADAPFTGDANFNGYTLFELGSSAAGPFSSAAASPATVPGSPEWRGTVFGGLLPNTNYFVRATYVDPDGVIGQAQQVIGPITTPASSPNAVTVDQVRAAVGDGEIYVTIDIHDDANGNSSGVIGFSTSPIGPFITRAASLSLAPKRARIRGLIPNVDYWIRVVVTDPDGVVGGSVQVLGPIRYTGPRDLALHQSITADPGWGCCPDASQLVDGRIQYDSFGFGYAWTGGTAHWSGGPAGVKQATIDFGSQTTFNRAAVWYHDPGNVPLAWKFQYSSDAITWKDAFSNNTPVCRTSTQPLNTAWYYPSCAHDAVFPAVTGQFFRYTFDDTTLFSGIHGWAVEIEVFSEVP